eukprot:ANDGO_02295.mRNA.1 Diphthine methyltransferase homolog
MEVPAESHVHLFSTFDTDLYADSVEFCLNREFAHHVAVGTYQLDASSERRQGRLYLCDATDIRNLTVLHRCDGDGIFDLKWSPYQDQHILCCALASGDLLLRGGPLLNEIKGSIRASEVATEADGSGGAMCLSCDWHPSLPWLASSLSDGTVAVCDLVTNSVLHRWKAHDYEAWIAAFDHNGGLLFTGGDDCLFRGWDLRSPDEVVFEPVFMNREHRAGVCTVSASPLDPFILATGCYDDAVRFWDIRMTRRSVSAVIDLGGGVWRARWHPSIPGRLVCACMRGGFAVIDNACLSDAGRSSGNPTEPSVTAVHEQGVPEAVAYGCDWSRMDGHPNLVVSASFYDHRVDVWMLSDVLPSR